MSADPSLFRFLRASLAGLLIPLLLAGCTHTVYYRDTSSYQMSMTTLNIQRGQAFQMYGPGSREVMEFDSQIAALTIRGNQVVREEIDVDSTMNIMQGLTNIANADAAKRGAAQGAAGAAQAQQAATAAAAAQAAAAQNTAQSTSGRSGPPVGAGPVHRRPQVPVTPPPPVHTP